ncbi:MULTISPECIES: 3-oxoacyl-ACP synthase III family protein [Glycomyces]|uniref:3-oxoacyl-[acyl-carrier-protein] synthase-3 n=2 Tax=Glycomyces TaxID=58113 RepID=A0A9X3ST02_9ACTN|nr:ketoacyl-ACP synthase III [Glycomyces lechevalierae]MDA1383414.1 ketoacyl-ACP synthase III [Glycomyces lechevalierae]MDR7336420.1 3-oxoacyl-[acyl-carrier-protein] synthase-3 [Glycomyces lechevalierae]
MHAWGLLGTGAYTPPHIAANPEIAAALRIDPQRILDSTGIRERRRAAPAQAASDLAAEAARAALAQAACDPADLGLLIVGTSTPDEPAPSTACRVQALIGARRAVAFDIGAACSGYLFGLKIARDWLAADPTHGRALVIGAEVYSRFLDPADRATALLFGDGAGASVLGRVPAGTGIAGVHLGSDGTQADTVLIPAGGSRRPATPDTVREGAHRIRMDAPALRKAIPETFDRALAATLTAHRLTIDDIDLLVPHQPNPRTLRLYADRAGIPHAKLAVIGEHLGNIGAASIPTALTAAEADGRLKPGDRVLLAAVGAGLTWGSALITWNPPGKERT